MRVMSNPPVAVWGGDPAPNVSYVQSLRGTMAAVGVDARMFFRRDGA